MSLRNYHVRRVYLGPMVASTSFELYEEPGFSAARRAHSMGDRAVLLLNDSRGNGRGPPESPYRLTQGYSLRNGLVYRYQYRLKKFQPQGEGPLSQRLWGLSGATKFETFERDLRAAIRKVARIERALKNLPTQTAALLDAFGPPIPLHEYTENYPDRSRHIDVLAQSTLKKLFFREKYALGLDVLGRTWTGNQHIWRPDSPESILDVAIDEKAPLHQRAAALWVIQAFAREPGFYERLNGAEIARLVSSSSLELRRAAVGAALEILMRRHDEALLAALSERVRSEIDPHIVQLLVAEGGGAGIPRETLDRRSKDRLGVWCRSHLQSVGNKILRLRYHYGTVGFTELKRFRLELGDPRVTIDLGAADERYRSLRETYLRDPNLVTPVVRKALAKYGSRRGVFPPRIGSLLIILENPLPVGTHSAKLLGEGGGKTHEFRLGDLRITAQPKP
ncbi:MAG: hypothetical protein AAF517_17210 [Planctomycetota bacterium]